ncbi:hypothetical protein HK100_006802, partial [Physocladia obscura]
MTTSGPRQRHRQRWACIAAIGQLFACGCGGVAAANSAGYAYVGCFRPTSPAPPTLLSAATVTPLQCLALCPAGAAAYAALSVSDTSAKSTSKVITCACIAVANATLTSVDAALCPTVCPPPAPPDDSCGAVSLWSVYQSVTTASTATTTTAPTTRTTAQPSTTSAAATSSPSLSKPIVIAIVVCAGVVLAGALFFCIRCCRAHRTPASPSKNRVKAIITRPSHSDRPLRSPVLNFESNNGRDDDDDDYDHKMVDSGKHRIRAIIVPTPPAPALEKPLAPSTPQLLGTPKEIRYLETRDRIGTPLPPLTKKDFDFGGRSGSPYSTTAIFDDSGPRHQYSSSSSAAAVASSAPISKTFGDFFSKFHTTAPTAAPSTTTMTTTVTAMTGNSSTDLRSTSTVPTPPSSSPLVGAMTSELKASLELDAPMAHATRQQFSHSPFQVAPPAQSSSFSPLLKTKKTGATPKSVITTINPHNDFSMLTPQSSSSSSSSPITAPPIPKKQSHSHFHIRQKRGNIITTSTSTATTNSLMMTSPPTSIMAPESSLAAWSSTQSSTTTQTILTVYDRSTILTASSSILGGLGGGGR